MSKIIKIHRPGRLKALSAKFLFATAAVSALYLVPVTDSVLTNGIFNSAALAQDEDEEGRRPPPSTRTSETLSRRVYSRIEEVMELRDQENYTGAIEILDELYAMFQEDRLNTREKQTMFLFYANIAQIQEDYEKALEYNREILQLEGIRQEDMEQTWNQVGNLNYILENYPEAIEAFETYNEIALEPNDDVYLRLAYAHYQLEDYDSAIPPLLRNMELVRAKGEQVPKNSYGLLRALYLTNEDYEKAYQVVRESVVLFGDPNDWILLAQLSAQLGRFNDQAYIYWIAGTGGYLDSGTDHVTLAQLLSNNENPYGCAEELSEGIEAGIVEDDLDNLSLTATCYQLAREDEKAIPYLVRAAELSEDGENYASLARVYMTTGNFEESIEAFENAFDKGGLRRPDQLYLLQARAFLELNRFDEGIQAARNAMRDERSADTGRTWVTHLGTEKNRYETLQRQRRELADYFR